MPASIRTTLYRTPGGAVVGSILTDVSRDDLRSGYQVKCESVYNANTYAWTLAYTPDSAGPASGSGNDFAGTPSMANLLPPEGSASKTCKFNVDWNGSYLIRLVVDAGLPTESTMFLRLRALTVFGSLKLVAAGERRDQTGAVPADVSTKGWAEDANQNMLRLLALVRRNAVSGRVLYVDANRGRDNSADPNDPNNIIRMPGPDPLNRDKTGIRAEATGFGDFSSINDAIAYAQAATSRGEPPLSTDNPYIISIAPGLYEENLNLVSNIYLVARYPGSPLYLGDAQVPTVQVRTVLGGTHEVSGVLGGLAHMSGIQLESYLTDPPLTTLVIRGGSLFLKNCVVAHGATGGIGISNDPLGDPYFLYSSECRVTGDAAATVFSGGIEYYFVAEFTSVSGGIDFLGDQEQANPVLLYCMVTREGGEALEGTIPGNLSLTYCICNGGVFLGGGDATTYNSELRMDHCSFWSHFSIDATATTGTVTLGGGANTVADAITLNGPNIIQMWDQPFGGASTTLFSHLVPGATAYNVDRGVVYVQVQAGGGITSIILPANPEDGREIYVKDVSGAASLNNIEVAASGGAFMEGGNPYTINNDWGRVHLAYCAAISTWTILG